jgi:Protein of unknown function (DUF2587)
MASAAAAGSRQQGVGPDVTGLGVAIVLDGPSAPCRACRVEEPARVLRMWALLSTASEELRAVALSPGAAPRLWSQLEVITTELERSVSPPLATELRHLVGGGGTTAPTLAELRVAYAGVLGWTTGLVIAMLSQLEAARASHARAVVPAGASGS